VQDNENQTNPSLSAALNAIPLDTDGDGLADSDESTHGSLINNPDTDGDEISDGDEVALYGSDLTLSDTDNDGFSDEAEIYIGSDPTSDTNLPPYNPPSSLVSYYSFDEGSGSTATDTAPSGTAETATRSQGTVFWDSSNAIVGNAALDLNGSTSMEAVTPFDSSTTEFTTHADPQTKRFSPSRKTNNPRPMPPRSTFTNCSSRLLVDL